jgi:predicted CoA-binding protein
MEKLCSKVLVDGKEFFGDDATTALKNLPAEVVDKVQVYRSPQ